MKTITIASLILFHVFSLAAQTSDRVQTNRGDLVIHPIQHASFVATWNGKTVYVDPVGESNLFSGFKSPDLVFITDIHEDHFSAKTLEAIHVSTTKYIVPQAVADLMPASLKANLVVLGNLQKIKLQDLVITTIPMYNLPETSDSLHPWQRKRICD